MKVSSSTPLYPELAASGGDTAQTFRLQKISEIEAFLRTEMESRTRLNKKYRRAVNALDGTCVVLGTACAATGLVGAGLLASGVGFVSGLVLEGVTAVSGLLDVAGVAVSRKCSAKATKHEAVRVLASSKLNTVHSHISKALEDCQVSDEEYKLILNEVEKYRVMKEEIRCRKQQAVGFNEETKNALIQRGRDEARASFIKKLAISDSPSP